MIVYPPKSPEIPVWILILAGWQATALAIAMFNHIMVRKKP